MTFPNENIHLEKTRFTKKLHKKNDIFKTLDSSSSASKKNIWKLFNDEVQPEKKTIENRIDCVYENSCGEKENCELCKSRLSITEEGFLCCVNKSCGLIYKEITDFSAEWRYYGADDTQGSDPTRCGMPINPILKESSYGCKVVNSGRSSYEMRKIKRYTEWQSMPYKEKSKYDDFQMIIIHATNAGIPKIIIDT